MPVWCAPREVEVLERAGPIGGSPIAEGYHSFGTLGVVLLLLVHVRNSFAPFRST